MDKERKFYLFLQDSLKNYLDANYCAMEKEIGQLSRDEINRHKDKKGACISEIIRKYRIDQLEVKWKEEEGMRPELPVKFKRIEGKENGAFAKYRFPVRGNVDLLQMGTSKVFRSEYCMLSYVDLRAKAFVVELEDNDSEHPLPVRAGKSDRKAEAMRRGAYIRKRIDDINAEVSRFNENLIEQAIDLYEERLMKTE